MSKISELTALAAVDVDEANDLLPVVDMSETGAARNKKMTFAAFLSLIRLDGLADVFVGGSPAPSDGDVLTYDATSSPPGWVASAPAAGGGSAIEVLDEGASETAALVSLNFTGAGVTATDDGSGNVEVAIPGGGAASYTPPASSTQAGSAYTGVLGDANGYIRFTSGSAVTFTVPANASVAYPVDTEIAIEQAGAGTVTVAPDTGVTVNSRGAALDTAGQYAVAVLKKVATNTWTLTGDIA